MKHLDDQIDQTLASLEGIEPAEAPPYFYGRLLARMEREMTTPRQVLAWQFKPIAAVYMVVAVLVIHALTWTAWQKNTQNRPAVENADAYSLYETVSF
jgi:hypothetical protein